VHLGEHAPLLGLVKEAEDHFAAGYEVAVRIQLRILPNPIDKANDLPFSS
jgi:hypothetical protein